MLGIDAALQLLILGFLSLLVNQYRGINTYAIGRLFTTIGYLISLSKVFNYSLTLLIAGIFLFVGTSISCVGISQFTDKKIKLSYLFIINLLFISVQSYFFIFNDIYIFKNNKEKYTILDKDTVQFEEPPVKFKK